MDCPRNKKTIAESPMKFKKESELQEFLHYVLGGTREVWLAPESRVDLETDDCLIEVKRQLDRAGLDSAAGQLSRYSPYSGGRRLVIAGCTPTNYTDSIRRLIEGHRKGGLEVWIVDQIPFFQEAYEKYTGDRAQHWEDVEPDEYYEDEDPFSWAKWAAGIIFLIFGLSLCANPSIQTTSGASNYPEVLAVSGEATVTKSAYIRRSPVIDASNVIGQTQVGDIVTLTGKRSLNSDAEWAEIVSTTGDRAWIAAPAVQPK
jgi:hypothetical protein